MLDFYVSVRLSLFFSFFPYHNDVLVLGCGLWWRYLTNFYGLWFRFSAWFSYFLPMFFFLARGQQTRPLAARVPTPLSD